MDASFHKLHDAEQKLKQVVIAKFDEAVKDEDLASVRDFIWFEYPSLTVEQLR